MRPEYVAVTLCVSQKCFIASGRNKARDGRSGVGMVSCDGVGALLFFPGYYKLQGLMCLEGYKICAKICLLSICFIKRI